jgi:hypothetical protein
MSRDLNEKRKGYVMETEHTVVIIDDKGNRINNGDCVTVYCANMSLRGTIYDIDDEWHNFSIDIQYGGDYEISFSEVVAIQKVVE